MNREVDLLSGKLLLLEKTFLISCPLIFPLCSLACHSSRKQTQKGPYITTLSSFNGYHIFVICYCKFQNGRMPPKSALLVEKLLGSPLEPSFVIQ